MRLDKILSVTVRQIINHSGSPDVAIQTTWPKMETSSVNGDKDWNR